MICACGCGKPLPEKRRSTQRFLTKKCCARERYDRLRKVDHPTVACKCGCGVSFVQRHNLNIWATQKCRSTYHSRARYVANPLKMPKGKKIRKPRPPKPEPLASPEVRAKNRATIDDQIRRFNAGNLTAVTL